MEMPQSLWNHAKERFDKLERDITDCYIGFLREIAEDYLGQDRKVYFRENRFVHWGEGNFGTLIIEGNEEVADVFGEYVSEIRFVPEIDKDMIKGGIEISRENLKEIKYGI